MRDTILIVDFGGQLTLLILRRLREMNVRAVLVEAKDLSASLPQDIAGVILSGGPQSVNDEDVAVARQVMGWQVPVLGICYGHQLLAHAGGGHVAQQAEREYGRATLSFNGHPVFAGVGQDPTVWMSHGDSVVNLPQGWNAIARTEGCKYAAMAHQERPLFSVQFHPESTHTSCGRQVLSNFAVSICRASQTYTERSLVEELKDSVREAAGKNGHILVACSLGVDSTTVAMLCQKALGPDRVHPIMVDNGLLRQEDLDLIEVGRRLLPNLRIVDAREDFLGPLLRKRGLYQFLRRIFHWPPIGVSDPEEKRRIIGTAFWHVFMREAKRIGRQFPIRVYSQGTISPDVIESGSSSSKTAVIKTHHNLVKRPRNFPFSPFEPLRDFRLFKDQVRELARTLGVPADFFSRHPFPGPGLAVRVSGELTADRLQIARAVDDIWIGELKAAGYYQRVSQAGATVLNDQSVCQMGDSRFRGWTIGLWAYETEDFMTASVPRLPDELKERVDERIGREVRGAGRVVYNITTKPRGTIEWE